MDSLSRCFKCGGPKLEGNIFCGLCHQDFNTRVRLNDNSISRRVISSSIANLGVMISGSVDPALVEVIEGLRERQNALSTSVRIGHQDGHGLDFASSFSDSIESSISGDRVRIGEFRSQLEVEIDDLEARGTVLELRKMEAQNE